MVIFSGTMFASPTVLPTVFLHWRNFHFPGLLQKQQSTCSMMMNKKYTLNSVRNAVDFPFGYLFLCLFFSFPFFQMLLQFLCDHFEMKYVHRNISLYPDCCFFYHPAFKWKAAVFLQLMMYPNWRNMRVWLIEKEEPSYVAFSNQKKTTKQNLSHTRVKKNSCIAQM